MKQEPIKHLRVARSVLQALEFRDADIVNIHICFGIAQRKPVLCILWNGDGSPLVNARNVRKQDRAYCQGDTSARKWYIATPEAFKRSLHQPKC